jgi:hypothetical protein
MDEDIAEGSNELLDDSGWENISAAIEESRIASRKNSMDWEPSIGESSHVSVVPSASVVFRVRMCV